LRYYDSIRKQVEADRDSKHKLVAGNTIKEYAESLRLELYKRQLRFTEIEWSADQHPYKSGVRLDLNQVPDASAAETAEKSIGTVEATGTEVRVQQIEPPDGADRIDVGAVDGVDQIHPPEQATESLDPVEQLKRRIKFLMHSSISSYRKEWSWCRDVSERRRPARYKRGGGQSPPKSPTSIAIFMAMSISISMAMSPLSATMAKTDARSAIVVIGVSGSSPATIIGVTNMIAEAVLVVLGLSVVHSAQRHKTLGGTSAFLNETMIAFAHHRQLEPIDELRAQCLSRAHVPDRQAQGGGVRSQSNDAAENGADSADHDQCVEPDQPE